MNKFFSIRDQIDSFVDINNDTNYKPKTADKEKIKEYKDIK